MEPIALGACGMTAQQFDEATPAEVQWRIEAVHAASDREWQRTAQLASWVAGLLGGKVTADELLGKSKDRSNWGAGWRR